MSDTPKKIIRGEAVENMSFCTQTAAENPYIRATVPVDEHAQDGYWKGLEEGRQQGFEAGAAEGSQTGYNEGYSTAHVELEQTIATLQRVIEGLVRRHEEVMDDAKPELIQFCLAVSEQVLMQELEKPAVFASVVTKLIDRAKNTLKANSYEVALSRSDYESLHTLLQDITNVQFKGDPNLPKGHFRIDTSLGLIYFDIKRVLKEIESNL